MVYELFFYRLAQGMNARMTHEFDLRNRDDDEAVLEPQRQIDPRKMADALLASGLGFERAKYEDAFNGGGDVTCVNRESIELRICEGDAEDVIASVWSCHVRLGLPTGDPHPERDDIYEKIIRTVTVICHDFGMVGYDTLHDREVIPSTLHQIAVDIAEGESQDHRPWWRIFAKH